MKDVSPLERAHLLTLAQAIVLKREGGVSALLDRVSAFVAPEPRGEPRP